MMKFSTLLQKLRGKQSKTPSQAELISFHTTPTGLKFVLSDEARHNLEQLACTNKLFAMQLVNLNMLQEQGFATKTDDAYEIPAEVVTMLDQDFHELFKLPPYFDGKFTLECHGLTYQPTFDVSLRIFKEHELLGAHIEGPFLKVGSQTYYSLTEPQWSALKAVENFHAKPAASRSIFDNNLLIHTLKSAQHRDNALHSVFAPQAQQSDSQDRPLTPNQSLTPNQAPALSQAMAQPSTQSSTQAALDEQASTVGSNLTDDWTFNDFANHNPFGDAELSSGYLGQNGSLEDSSFDGVGSFAGRLGRGMGVSLGMGLGQELGGNGLPGGRLPAGRAGKSNLPGLNLNLAHFENLHTQQPESVSLAAEEDSEGNLILSPVFAHCSPEDISKRLGNVPLEDQPSVLHINDQIVLLQKKITHAVNQIRKYRRIPKKHVAQFLNAPTAFFQDPNIDLDCGFSLRVKGAEVFTHKYFGEVEYKNGSWFEGIEAGFQPLLAVEPKIESFDDLQELEQCVKDALKVGSNTVEFAGETFALDGPQSPQTVLEKLEFKLSSMAVSDLPSSKEEAIVVKIDSNDEQLEYSAGTNEQPANPCNTNFSTENLLKTPFAHQVEGIKWILSRFEAGRNTKQETSGGLLADDMGLGKTFMTLVAIEEILKRYKEPKPVLIVGPLSLLENWEKEIDNTFKTCPFSDIVVLQANRDLKLFQVRGAQRETHVNQPSSKRNDQPQVNDNASNYGANGILECRICTPISPSGKGGAGTGACAATAFNAHAHTAYDAGKGMTDGTQEESLADAFAGVNFALKVGPQFEPFQLDRPGRLVLASYETLRDYQFSLSRIDWSIVACDEAQFLKNPNTLVTRAAKALKADFVLMMTGTPVENSLADIWCLMDTAVPGLLGAWQDFRQKYISPINRAPAEEQLNTKIAVGQELRAAIGDYMLRRTKEDNLSGLPKKVVFSPIADSNNTVLMPLLGQHMVGKQLDRYNAIVRAVISADRSVRRKLALSSLQGIKLASIHPALTDSNCSLADADPLDSCKIKAMDAVLEEIKKRDEKVIIFAISKKVQEFLAVYLRGKYQVPVQIINGDTKAVASPYSGKATRAQLLDEFQNSPGFGIIILSPIAVGVGLTIVGANNVIHMERHWNPAKEDQATDRVYRIGQKRQVNVYIPMALHPQTESFDEKLNVLLRRKVDLSTAVVTTEAVAPRELDSLFADFS